MAMRLVEEKLQALGATTPEKRRANFNCTLCVAWPHGEVQFFEGRVYGTSDLAATGHARLWL